MSRPSSRVSSAGRVMDQQHARHTNEPESSSSKRERERRSVSSSSSNATVQARPHSSLSGTSSGYARVPFTPGATSKVSKMAHLGLSAKQVDKLSESIANIQRGPTSNGQRQEQHYKASNLRSDSVSRAGAVAPQEARALDRQDRKGKARVVPEASFIAETSFVDAPLNSRVINTAAAHQERITTKRLRQLITKTDADEDDESDLQQIDDQDAQDDQTSSDPLDDISQADLVIQEALLVEDLLGVLIGIDGQFIRMKQTRDDDEDANAGEFRGHQFVIDEAIDPSLRELAYKIVHLATFHDSIQSFVEAYSHLNFGLTSHALCSGIRDFVEEYDALVARLEEHFEFSPAFSLQKFYYFVQPALHQLFLIYELIQDLTTTPSDVDTSAQEDSNDMLEADSDDDDDRFGGGRAMKEALRQMTGATGEQTKPASWSAGGPVKGGEVLAIIDERLQRTSGDPEAFQIYSTLLLKASQPYAQCLLRWVTTGNLIDPYDEFMIREQKSLHRTALDQDYVDEYWERKYTLKDLSMGSPTSAVESSLDADRLLLNSRSSGSMNEFQDAFSLASRSMKREKGLGGGAIIPGFLEAWKVKILLAGKYLNVIRESGSGDLLEDLRGAAATPGYNQSVAASSDPDIDMTSEDFQNQLDMAYCTANKACLTLLIERQSLFSRLRSLKHHFFLDHGDSFTHFLDLAGHELSKKSKHVSLSKLQSLLDLAIRNPSSASSADPYKEDVTVAISSHGLTEWLLRVATVDTKVPGAEDVQGEYLADSASAAGDGKDKEKDRKKEDKHTLTGMEALSLDYTVNFPLSLVLSRKAILRYQLIFRHLLALKHLEQALTSNWLEHTKNPIWRKRTPHIGLEKWKSRVFTLRCRMLAFVQQMYAFAVSEVLESNWRKLMTRLQGVETVDQLLRYHTDFLDTCIKQCMLSNAKLLKIQSRLMTTCTLFLSYNSKFTKTLHNLANEVEETIANGGDWTNISIEQQTDFLNKFEVNFYRHQKLHLDSVTFHAMSDSGSLLALVVRLASTVPESDGRPA